MSRATECFIIGISLVGIAGIWFADRWASEDFRFGFLYMLPLAAAAWWGPRHVALICAGIACLALVVNDVALRPATTLVANVWNEFTRVTTFFAVTGLIALVRDSSARVRAESERAFRLAVTDQLTGLYNRHYLNGQLHRIHAAAARHRRPYALLAIDLDGLKKINDRFGHSGGDAVLVAFANDLKELVRADDITVRTGGDEFLVVLPDATTHEAAVLAERILTRVLGSTDRRRLAGLSAGVTSWRPYVSVETLLAEVDQLVYESKRRGGGRVSAAPGVRSA